MLSGLFLLMLQLINERSEQICFCIASMLLCRLTFPLAVLPAKPIPDCSELFGGIKLGTGNGHKVHV